MISLVLNCGSSSIKYQVIEMDGSSHRVLAKGLAERIGMADSAITHRPAGGEAYSERGGIYDHTRGIERILALLVDPAHGVISSLEELSAVGHRVAHGGEYFADSVLVDEGVVEKIRGCSELAPLHNPANLKGIQAVEAALPGVPQVAVFDTSFHQSIPPRNYLYALPWSCYEDLRVRKYGFHGTSHRFVAEKACRMTGLDFRSSKIITCHIGNGASVTAILDGLSFDTSMGFTPVDGLVMGTRCGELDPGALLYLMDKLSLDAAAADELINKRSGVFGLTGISSDMRDISSQAEVGNQRARLALDIYYGRIKGFVGSYAATMGGVDLIVFTGGVGENDPDLRGTVCRGMEFMGVSFDQAANKGLRGRDMVLSAPDSAVRVAVVATDEELVIATDTYNIVKTL